MANITKREGGGGLTAEAFAQAGAAGFNEARPTAEGGGTPFLKIDKEDGQWSFGQENIVVPDDALFGVFPQTFASGFVAWKGLSLEAKAMAMIGEPVINPADLPPVVAKTGWEPNVGVAMVLIESKSKPELEGTVVIFEQRSRGGIEAWGKLYDACMARAKGGNGDFAAVVALGNSTYTHKEWGLVYKPVFVVEDWEIPDDLVSDFGKPPAIVSKEANDGQAQGNEVKAVSRRSRGAAAAAEAPPIKDITPTEEPVAPARRRRSKE